MRPFPRSEQECMVFPDGSPGGDSILMLKEFRTAATVYAGLSATREIACRATCRPGRVEKRGRSAHVPAAEVRMEVAVKTVCAGLCDHVQDHAAGLAVFRIVIIREDLELLHFFQ